MPFVTLLKIYLFKSQVNFVLVTITNNRNKDFVKYNTKSCLELKNVTFFVNCRHIFIDISNGCCGRLKTPTGVIVVRSNRYLVQRINVFRNHLFWHLRWGGACPLHDIFFIVIFQSHKILHFFYFYLCLFSSFSLLVLICLNYIYDEAGYVVIF